MPTDAFNQWAERFDRRYRFGIPALPIRKAATVPPSIVSLPARQGSMKFSTEDVTATIELLSQADVGQAVRLTDAPDDKEATSRRRAEIMKDQIETSGSVWEGYKLRGHVMTAGEPTIKKVSGKNYKFYPENWAAISLVVDDTPPEAAAEADDAPPVEGAPGEPDGSETDTPEGAGPTPEGATPDGDDDDAPTTGRGRGRRS